MLKNSEQTLTDKLARAQLVMVHRLADEIRLTTDELQRALNLDNRIWQAWTLFLAGGRLPAEPPLPEMLRRISEAAYRLVVVAHCGTTHREAGKQLYACFQST